MSVELSAHEVSHSWAPFPRTLMTLVSSGVLGVGQTYAVIPLLGDLAADFGVSASAATWMSTAFSLAFALSFLVVGPLADRFGPRRIIRIGLVCAAVTTLAVPFASTLAAGVVLRCLQGMAVAMLIPTGFAYVTAHIEPGRRPVALSALASAGIASAVVLQVAAQLLEPSGWRAVFVASGIAFAVLVVPASTLLRPDSAGATARAESVVSALAAVPKLLIRPRLLGLYLATAALLGAFVIVYTVIELHGPAAVDGSGAMLALRASALPAVIAAPLLTRAFSAVPPRTRAVASFAVSALAALVLPLFGGGVAALAVVLLVFVGGLAFGSPGLVAAIHGRAGGSVGAATALYTASLFLGASVGPQVVAALGGFAATAVATAAILAVAAALVWLSAARD